MQKYVVCKTGKSNCVFRKLGFLYHMKLNETVTVAFNQTYCPQCLLLISIKTSENLCHAGGLNGNIGKERVKAAVYKCPPSRLIFSRFLDLRGISGMLKNLSSIFPPID